MEDWMSRANELLLTTLYRHGVCLISINQITQLKITATHRRTSKGVLYIVLLIIVKLPKAISFQNNWLPQ